MMSPEFDHLRDAFASSVPGRIIAGWDRAASAAWRTSSAGQALRSFGDRCGMTPAPVLIANIAVAIAIAAVTQLLLIGLMPRTVAPAMPSLSFVLVAVFAAAAAWQSAAIVAAWPASRLARWLRH